MRKIIGTCLACVMLLSVFSPVVTAAGSYELTEEDAAQIGEEAFLAWYTITYNDYLVHDYDGPNRVIVEKLKSNKAHTAALIGWRTLTFDGASEVKYGSAEVGYYETLLFDLFYDEQNKSFVTEFTDNFSKGSKQLGYYASVIGSSAWKSMAELEGEFIYTPVKELLTDKEKTDEVFEQLGKLEEIKGAIKLVGDVSQFLYCAQTVSEYVHKLAQVQALLNTTVEKGAILGDLGKMASSNAALKMAIAEYAIIMDSTMTQEYAIAMLLGKTSMTKVAEFGAEKVYGAVISAANNAGLAIKIGQGVGKICANGLFNTTDLIAKYYELEALYELETLLREKVGQYEKNFLTNPTEKMPEYTTSRLECCSRHISLRWI